MLGNLSLGAAQNLLEVADAKGALLHQIENPEPGLITKTLVNLDEFHLCQYSRLTICVNNDIELIPLQL